VTVVTGAASGIGRAVTVDLLDQTDHAVVGIDLSWPEGGLAEGVIPLTADVADSASLGAAFAELDSLSLGVVTRLVCAAGITQRVPTLDLSADQWHRMLAVHLDGALFACQQSAARMRDGGAIVLFSSVAEFFGWPERASYAVAKAGLSALARSLAVEWAPMGIRVNTIAPGYVDTPLVRGARERGELAVEPAGLHALGRLADPEEIARPVRFLLSADAAFVTGETLVVDGGYRILKSQ
jgi:NAD(P)-dependent dehydrogenase (short-subunit alcohol dehydrogenase family)